MTAATFQGRYLLVPVVLGDGPAIVTVRIDMVTCECSLSCSVPWPDEVILSDTFGEAMR